MMNKNKNMKGFIFTLDAVFSLIVASAAISILLYVHFTQPLAYQTPVAYTSTVLSNLLNTKLGQVSSSGIISNPVQSAYKSPYADFGYLNQHGQTPADYISVADTNFNSTFSKNNAITLSAWIYEFPNSECEVSVANIYNPPSTSYPGAAIFRFGVSGGSGWATSINAVMLELFTPTVQTNMFSSLPVPYGVWNYITASYNGTYVNFYINGIPAGSTAYSSTLSTGPNSELLIGANPNSGCYAYFPGYVSNLQIYNTALSPSQVSQLYDEGIGGVPVSGSGLVGWYPLNGNANDYSGNNYDGVQHSVNFVNTSYVSIGNYNATDNSSLLYTLSELYLNNESTYANFIAHNIGVNSTSAIFINDTYAPSYGIASFNGISSSITTDKHITNSIINWTVEAWINPANLDQLGIAVENGWDNNVVGNGYGFGISNGGLGTGSQLFGLFSGVTTINTGYTFSSPNRWYDIVMTRNQSGITSFYVNGVQTPNTTSSVPLTSNDFYIGSDTGIRYFNGSIADVQFYNTSLSPSQISKIYSSGIGGMPISNSKLIGWWPLEGNVNDYSGYGNAGFASNIIYKRVPFTPIGLSDAYLVSKSSSPMLLSVGNKSSIYNVSVVTWH